MISVMVKNKPQLSVTCRGIMKRSQLEQSIQVYQSFKCALNVQMQTHQYAADVGLRVD